MKEMIETLRNRREAGDEGFTLIELLIVIVILGVLAGIVVLGVSGITDRGETSACKSDKKTVEVATEAYYAKNKSYPANTGVLVTAGLLREAPAGVTTAGGVVSAAPAC